jgi:acetyltransferase-like isoleucine patch superfamily enzyme
MQVGRHTYGVNNITEQWSKQAQLVIGSFCSIAANVTIYLGGNHKADRITTYPFGNVNVDVFNNKEANKENKHPATNGNVIIGNDVWIGNNVTIMSGTKIGDGAVVGCNSRVSGKVKPYSVVMGNPSMFLYYRFNQEIIKKLLKIRWWEFDDEDINELSPLLCSNEFDKFFTACYNLKNKYGRDIS